MPATVRTDCDGIFARSAFSPQTPVFPGSPAQEVGAYVSKTTNDVARLFARARAAGHEPCRRLATSGVAACGAVPTVRPGPTTRLVRWVFPCRGYRTAGAAVEACWA